MHPHQKAALVYVAKFLGVFFLLFYGTEGVIALASPGGLHHPFVEQHLNFIDPFRTFLLASSRELLTVFHFQARLEDLYTLTMVGGKGVRMVYSCVGYGVLSFWIAFVVANRGGWKKKVGRILGGCGALCAINIARVSLLLVAVNKGWPIPFGWDHHTWFNIVAYLLIFALMWGYDRGMTEKEKEPPDQTKKDLRFVNGHPVSAQEYL